MTGAVIERLAAVGMRPAAAERIAGLYLQADSALEVMRGRTLDDARLLRFWVPGRIEVLGKHTDYAGGRSLLSAVERGFAVVALPRADRRVRVMDARTGEVAEGALDPDLAAASGDWRTYPFTVARRVARDFGAAPLVGADIAFMSDLPIASGISSSSALVVGMFLALSEVNALAGRAEYQRAIAGREALGEYLGAVENGLSFGPLSADQGVGTFGGSEDHTAILCARAGMLSQYAFCPVRFERTVPVPSDHTFLIASSGVAAHKTSNALDSYNRVSSLAQAAFAQWREVSGCGEATLGAVAGAFGAGFDDTQAELRAAMERATGGRFGADELTERVVQFVIESEQIIPAAADALAEGRLGDLGVLVDRSMANAERLLHNQVKETVFLARRARELGATAASAFGAGFGGSVWALIPRSAADEFRRQLMRDYAAWSGRQPTGADFFLTDAGPSARQV